MPKHILSAIACAATLVIGGVSVSAPVRAQPAASDPTFVQLADILSGSTNSGLLRGIAVNFVKDFVDGHFAERPDAKVTWGQPDTERAVALYYAPVAREIDRRVIGRFAASFPAADAAMLVTALATPEARRAMDCALRVPAAQRNQAAWLRCEKAQAVTFTAAEREALNRAQIAYSAAVAIPAVNGAVGGTVCQALARFGQHMSVDGTTYTFGASFALTGSEEPRRCDVLKARWSALIGYDQLAALEDKIVFEKKDD